MKKQYISPDLKVVKMAGQQMLAASCERLPLDRTDENEVTEGLSLGAGESISEFWNFSY